MRNSKTRKTVLVLLLLVIASISASLTFTYWSSGVNGNDKTVAGEVTIGEGLAAETVVNVVNQTSTGPLVPVGQLANSPSGSVDSVSLTFAVDWDSAVTNTATGAQGTLSAVVGAVSIDGSGEYASLVNTTVTIANNVLVADGDAKEVVVTFTLNNPADKTAYEAVAEKDIVANITFTVTPQ